MLTQKFRSLLEAYHTKKWFPDLYPDPYEEFIDYISEGFILELLEEFEKTKNRKALEIAYYIYRILPAISLGDLLTEYRRAFNQKLLGDGTTPDFAFYYLRSFPGEQANLLWHSFQDWTVHWHSVLHSWLHPLIHFERRFDKLQDWNYSASDPLLKRDPANVEKELISSKDLFEWQMKRRTAGQTLPELLQVFRLSGWDAIADWNDFSGFARSIADRGFLKNVPVIRKSPSHDAVQFLFPISPPDRVILEYGKAAGPADSLRFLFELGRGFFLTGMNPELAIEERICGDPALSLFWGFVYSHLLMDAPAITRVVSLKAQNLAEEMRFILHFWHRYDTVLSLYRKSVDSELKHAEDLYVALFESAFPFPAPRFLYLYDLDRSQESAFRAMAFRCATAAVERFRELFGKHWFSAPRFARRVRDYWWEGYRLKLSDILQDLSVTLPPSDSVFLES